MSPKKSIWEKEELTIRSSLKNPQNLNFHKSRLDKLVITEMGVEQIGVKNCWAGVVLPVIENSGIAYFLVWIWNTKPIITLLMRGNNPLKTLWRWVDTGKVVLEKGINELEMYKN